MDDPRERAVHLLQRYLRLLAQRGGRLPWDHDNDAEVRDLVDSLIEAARQEDLPAVAGTLQISLAQHETRCRRLIGEEQRKASPDTALIGLLCDAVRLTREYAESMAQAIEADTEERGARDPAPGT